MQKQISLVKTTIITQVTIIVLGAVVWFVTGVVGNFFVSNDLVQRVTALEGEKLDVEIYATDIKPMKDDIREMKADIKTLLTRKQVYLDIGDTMK